MGRNENEDDGIRPCAYCNGSGTVETGSIVDSTKTCPVCQGRRMNRIVAVKGQKAVPCSTCSGSGKGEAGGFASKGAREPCRNCHGTGWLAL